MMSSREKEGKGGKGGGEWNVMLHDRSFSSMQVILMDPLFLSLIFLRLPLFSVFRSDTRIPGSSLA